MQPSAKPFQNLTSCFLQTSLHWHKGKFMAAVGFPAGWDERSACRSVQHGQHFVALAEGVMLHTCLGVMVKELK